MPKDFSPAVKKDAWSPVNRRWRNSRLIAFRFPFRTEKGDKKSLLAHAADESHFAGRDRAGASRGRPSVCMTAFSFLEVFARSKVDIETFGVGKRWAAEWVASEASTLWLLTLHQLLLCAPRILLRLSISAIEGFRERLEHAASH